VVNNSENFPVPGSLKCMKGKESDPGHHPKLYKRCPFQLFQEQMYYSDYEKEKKIIIVKNQSNVFMPIFY
jgi:hypothetical protein